MPGDHNDKFETLVRKCIVFPADDSQTRIVHMLAQTVAVEDITSLGSHSRYFDMISTFGASYRTTRVMAHRSALDGLQITYLFFYNLSPNLPININIANIIGETPSDLDKKKRLFWRGDVVAMKVQPKGEQLNFHVESLDADLFELRPLEEFLREFYQEGVHECVLRDNEHRCE